MSKPYINEWTGKVLCTYPQCAEAKRLGQRNAHLFWAAVASCAVSVVLALWVHTREPQIHDLRIENARLTGEVLYLKGRLAVEGVIDEVTRAQRAEIGAAAPLYTLPPVTNIESR